MTKFLKTPVECRTQSRQPHLQRQPLFVSIAANFDRLGKPGRDNFGTRSRRPNVDRPRAELKQASVSTEHFRRPPFMLRGHTHKWRESIDFGNDALPASMVAPFAIATLRRTR
jgi:hypothetical protein